MDEAFVVDSGKSRRHCTGDGESFARRQVVLRAAQQALDQWLTGEVFHGDEKRAAVAIAIINRHDVFMPQLARKFGFMQSHHITQIHLADCICTRDLDGNYAAVFIDARGEQILGLKDIAGAAGSEMLDQEKTSFQDGSWLWLFAVCPLVLCGE